MKPIEILSAIPKWSKASAKELLDSPAWALPCKLGDEQCVMRLDATHPADSIDLAVKIEDETHTLRLPDNPAFEEIHKVWASRAEMPEPILLAIVEKECGPLLQLVENAVRRQLKIIGLVKPGEADGAEFIYARISNESGDIATFALTLSPAIVAVLGEKRNIDTNHPSVRDEVLPAEREFAAFQLPATDATTLEPGDSLLLPEIESLSPRLVIDGRFVLAEGSLASWKDDGLYRVIAAESETATVGMLMDAAGGESAEPGAAPKAETPLKLVRMGRTIASGRLSRVGDQPAFAIDAVLG